MPNIVANIQIFTDSKQTNKNTFSHICKQTMSISVLPSFVYVSRWRPLAGGPILMDLLIQWQWQWSISYRQPQHQSLLGNRDGLITSSTHVLLGIVKALDRLAGKKSKKNCTLFLISTISFWFEGQIYCNSSINLFRTFSNWWTHWRSVYCVYKMGFVLPVGLMPLDALKQVAVSRT